MSIKTNFEFPRGDSPEELAKQGQRLAQDLSKNFKILSKSISNNSSLTAINLDGVYVNGLWSGTTSSQTYSATLTLPHSLNAVPSGWLLVDNTHNGTTGFGAGVDIIRTAWTNLDITIRINLSTGSNGTFSGSFRILILR